MTSSFSNLMSYDRSSLEDLFSQYGEPSFRAKQCLQWIYQKRVLDVRQMTNMSLVLREKLAVETSTDLPIVDQQHISKDGTIKWLLRLKDNNKIECVYIPENDRGTLCISSQVGCSLNCSFCATGRQGYNRNLTVDEIVSQLWLAEDILKKINSPSNASSIDSNRRHISNVVLMGMGEPLLNFNNVVSALRIMLDDFCFSLSRRKITLSTAGVVPMIDKLAAECQISLAVSLHAPTDDVRDILVPINKKYPIAELLNACRRYTSSDFRQRVTFEYVMLEGVNDSEKQSVLLAKLLKGLPAKINLIPFNSSFGIDYKRSSDGTIERFSNILRDHGLFVITRKTRGDDIQAACGQLAGDIEDRTKRSQRILLQSKQY